MPERFRAGQPVHDLLAYVKEDHPHLHSANFAIEFVDNKPFIRDRINLGKISKFSQSAKLWQNPQKYDFCITLCADVWHAILTTEATKKALLDLHLSCIMVEYEPELDENDKPVKDEFGRVQYTNTVKTNDDGTPKLRLIKPDAKIYADNIRRYGLWLDCLVDLSDAIFQENPAILDNNLNDYVDI